MKYQVKKGFTLVELLVVLGIVSVLVTLVFINILRPQVSTAATGGENLLISDLKTQQISAMSGENGAAQSASASGIFFGTTSYTLFQGIKYVPNDVNNFTVNLGTNLTFQNVTLPNSLIVFASGSGEILNFTPGSDSVTVTHSSGASKTLKINRYGVVTSVN